MLKRRQLFQFAGVAAVAAVGGTAWTSYAAQRSTAVAGGQFRHYPFDPVAAENFKQKLFVPTGSGPFGVLDVAGPLKIRATAASFALMRGGKSPFLLYQTEQAGKAYQNPILRMESGKRFTASLHNELNEPTIIHWHGLHTPAAMDGHPASTIEPGAKYEYDYHLFFPMIQNLFLSSYLPSHRRLCWKKVIESLLSWTPALLLAILYIAAF